MKRLTTDNPDNNVETALNFVFGHDGWAHIRAVGDQMNVPLTDWAKAQCVDRGCEYSLGITAEEIDATIWDCIMDGEECPVATAYCFACQAVNLRGKLMRYEDTGLEPEEIEGLLERGTPLEGGTAELMKAYLAIGSVEHLSALAEAKKDGRLMVLPCLKGVPLYVLTDDGIERTKCRKIVFMERSGKPFPVVIAHVPNIPSGIAHWEFWNIDFGKTVFLTREEAEAALKKKEKSQ